MARCWGSVVCDNERSRSNVLSWFSAFVPAEWGLPLKCDVQEDEQTGRETAMRALFQLPDGRLKEAVRRKGARTTTITMRDPSRDVLKGFRPALAETGQ